MSQRCCPKPILAKMVRYPRSNKFTTTELIEGTRRAVLMRSVDYYERPENQRYMILGTLMSEQLAGADAGGIRRADG